MTASKPSFDWLRWLLFFSIVAMMLAVGLSLGSASRVTLAYSDFQALVQQGSVKEVTITEQQLSGTADFSQARELIPAFRSGPSAEAQVKTMAFVVRRVPDPDLVADLQAAHVRFAGGTDESWFGTMLAWVVPVALLVVLWNWMLRKSTGGRLGGIMELGKSKARVFVQKDTGVHFADVAGIDEAKAELMEVVDFLKNPERYRRLGARIPKGVLIVGAPGTGKTLLAKAVAGEAAVPFLSISGSEFVEMFVGVGAARVRDLFQQAEKLAPCIIFVDELDALGRVRGLNPVAANEEREQTLNQLLVQMDGFETKKGVIILAATNRPETLDPALLRPGRFDRQVALDRPDIRGREQILKVHARRLTLGEDVDLAAIAAKTAGFAGADLANIVNEAALRAARENKARVEMGDFDAAIERAVAGLEKKSRVMNAKEKEIVAFHEAGHALVAESRPTADRVAKLSIIPRGIAALGFMQQLPTEDRYLLRRSELLDRLDVLLGGRVAEQLVFGETSTGALDDLQRATDLVRQMITRYGMSETLGPATLERVHTPFLGPEGLAASSSDYSERTARLIDEEARALLQDAEDRVNETLRRRRPQLDAVAQLLLQRETIDRAALLELLEPGRVLSPPPLLVSPPAATSSPEPLPVAVAGS